ncbi:MAG: hypothetical protein L0Z62_08800 [Gemmataceae bacterium]|nr:hypothetical protein [Gemmataceae bacterium]
MSAPALAFPGSRALAAWWRHLAPLHPQAVWIGHLPLHRVEALVKLLRPRHADRFTRFVLEALHQEPCRPGGAAGSLAEGEQLTRLDERFHIGRPLLRQVLRGLHAEGLVRPAEGGCFTLTPLGEQALEQGQYPHTEQERRGFHFVEPRRAGDAPHYLNLNSHGGLLSPAAEERWFDVATLHRCLARPAEWKQRYGFPAEVSAIVTAEAVEGPAWRQVIVDRAERLVAVMVPLTEELGSRKLLGFGVRQEGWILHGAEPAFVVCQRWDELFPELTADLPAGAWREAWLAWCRPRSIPEGEADTCTLEAQGARLLVRAPAQLIERLRAARSDAIKGEAWVLVGEGALRRAALLELVEGS